MFCDIQYGIITTIVLIQNLTYTTVTIVINFNRKYGNYTRIAVRQEVQVLWGYGHCHTEPSACIGLISCNTLFLESRAMIRTGHANRTAKQ